MTYIALIPEEPLFQGEHLTLVWVGHKLPTHHPLAMGATSLVRLIEMYSARTKEDPGLEKLSFSVYGTDEKNGPYHNFNGHLVATGKVSYPLVQFRSVAEFAGLNGSEFTWTPHITGQQGSASFWRKPGERVMFRNALLL
jgi:hypothetical protein